MRILLDVAKTFEEKKNYKEALKYAREDFSIAKRANVKPYILQEYLLLSKLYKHFKKNDSAYFFMQQYILLNDSVRSQQFSWRLTNYKKQTDFKKKFKQ